MHCKLQVLWGNRLSRLCISLQLHLQIAIEMKAIKTEGLTVRKIWSVRAVNRAVSSALRGNENLECVNTFG